MNKIIPGIYQLQVQNPSNPQVHNNVYLVQGDDECLLIDAGRDAEGALQSLEEQLTEIGVDFKDISQIVVTHSHPDHYGLAGKLRQLSQAKICLHELGKNLINTRYQNMDEFLRQMKQWLHINGVPPDELPTPRRAPANMKRMMPTLPDIILHGGETISIGVFKLQVLWTPGHSPGHICLYEPSQKLLFTGDHILPVTYPNVSLWPQSGINPLGDFFNSLNILKQLDVDLVLPAHEQLFTDLPARIEELSQHQKQRKLEILETIKTKPKTAYQISTEIIWKPQFGGVRWQDLPPMDRRMTVPATLAHLESIRIDGEADTFTRDSIIFYQHTREALQTK